MGNDADLVALGRVIRRCRKQLGFSQEKLAGDAALSRNYIGQIERGEREAKVKTLIAIVRALESHPVIWEQIGTALRNTQGMP
ncbi:MAG: helix-turn-helix domain-containing protein, partial [Bradyrhizobium sp.]